MNLILGEGGFQNGMNYQRLEDDCWQSEPYLGPGHRHGYPGHTGHTGARDDGFTREKKVLDDDNDEHVLYVQ